MSKLKSFLSSGLFLFIASILNVLLAIPVRYHCQALKNSRVDGDFVFVIFFYFIFALFYFLIFIQIFVLLSNLRKKQWGRVVFVCFILFGFYFINWYCERFVEGRFHIAHEMRS